MQATMTPKPIAHFLLPFALPSAKQGSAVLPARATPALDLLIRHATVLERTAGEDFQRSLSHESWMASRYGLVSPHTDGDLPLAPYMLLADGLQTHYAPGDQRWACVQPVHIQVTHDQLLLIDPEHLDLKETEAAALLAHVRPLIEELGITLVAPTPLRWYLSGEALGELSGASPLRAVGRSIDIWLPHTAVRKDALKNAPKAPPGGRPSAGSTAPGGVGSGGRSRPWMKLQNEIQMAWHEHPVNEAREGRRQLPVNAVWLHGQGMLAPVTRPFSTVFSGAAASRGLALAAGAAVHDLPARFDEAWRTLESDSTRGTPGTAPRVALMELNALSSPFISEDWGSWLMALADIDTHWLAPALTALRNGTLSQIRCTLCSDTGAVTLSLSAFDLKKFWRRRTPFSLLLD
jgi:hypothetical protein